jgi:hypothetical protein
MNAFTSSTNRVVRSVATGSALTIASLFFLAPAASASPFEICELEQGPNGPQCVQEPKQAELCKLDENLKCIQPPKQVELCELEQGPNGLQCVDNELDEKAPVPDPDPPVDPEPEPEGPADEIPEPEPAPAVEAAKPSAAEPVAPQAGVAADETGVPDFEIAAGPAVEQPAARSYAGWIGLGLVSLGLVLLYARRRRQVQEDAASALQKM